MGNKGVLDDVAYDVADNVADVAFLGHKGVEALVRDNPIAADKATSCGCSAPQGVRVPVDLYRRCHLANRPVTLMASPHIGADPNHQVQLQQTLIGLHPGRLGFLRGRKVSKAPSLTHLPLGSNISDFIDAPLLM